MSIRLETLFGTKQTIFLLNVLLIIILDKVVGLSMGALIASGLASMGCFVAYGLSDASWTQKKL